MQNGCFWFLVSLMSRGFPLHLLDALSPFHGDDWHRHPIMEREHRDFLLKNRPELVSRLNTGLLLPHLESEGIVTWRAVASIRASPDKYARTERLLDYLPRLGPKAFPAFEKWLKRFQPLLYCKLFGATLPEECAECDPERLCAKSLLPESGGVRALVLATREAA